MHKLKEDMLQMNTGGWGNVFLGYTYNSDAEELQDHFEKAPI